MTSFLARDHLPRASLRCRVAWVLTVSRFLAELQLSFTVVILETTYNNPGDLQLLLAIHHLYLDRTTHTLVVV
jgi:hypothetical protein